MSTKEGPPSAFSTYYGVKTRGMVRELEAKSLATEKAMADRRAVREEQAMNAARLLDCCRRSYIKRKAEKSGFISREEAEILRGDAMEAQLPDNLLAGSSRFNPIIIDASDDSENDLMSESDSDGEGTGDTAKTQPYTNSCAMHCNAVHCGEQECSANAFMNTE
ncbi:MAG: hypothetical protein [Circoviridae sp.]|nr:MAG: hypothetical protein [Circoviridae sp.]